MKIYSHTCLEEKSEERECWLASMGLTVFKQVPGLDGNTLPPRKTSTLIFVVPDKETETLMKLRYPEGTFKECSA